MAGVVEVPLLLPEPWFNDLLDEAEGMGVTVARLLRRLIADHLVEPPYCSYAEPVALNLDRRTRPC